MRSRNSLLLGVIAVSLLLPAGTGTAQQYPSKRIDYVTHNQPGAVMDVLGRLIGEIVQKEKFLDQPIVVVNKPGSGGGAAFGYLLEKKGEAHMFMGVPSNIMLGTPLIRKLPYSYKNFTPIANLVVDGGVVLVRTGSPFKTFDDLLAEVRKRPKELTQGMTAPTSTDALMARAIMKRKAVQWNFVSFKSEPEAVSNTLGGHVDFVFANPSNTVEHVRVGKLRVLLAVAPQRYAAFKDVPTTREAGLGEPIVSYRGFVGPSGMPDYAVKTIESTLKKVLESARFKAHMDKTMMQPYWMSSSEYGKWLDEESGRVKQRLIDAGMLK